MARLKGRTNLIRYDLFDDDSKWYANIWGYILQTITHVLNKVLLKYRIGPNKIWNDAKLTLFNACVKCLT